MKQLILIFTTLIILSFNTNPNDGKVLEALPDFIRTYEYADSAYSSGDYKQASLFYKKVLENSPRSIPAATHFKFAMSLYYSGNYTASNENFTDILEKNSEYLPQYVRFFRIKNLWHTNPSLAAGEAEYYIAKYPKSALADSMVLPIADYYYSTDNFQKSRKYYELFNKWNFDKNKRAYASIHSALSNYRLGNKSNAREEFRQILGKYSSKEETLELVDWIADKEPELYKQQFFKVNEVFFDNGLYEKAKGQLEEYIKSEKDEKLKEKARFNLVRLYYVKGQYQTALYGFKNLLENLANKNLEPSIRLYFARIYLNQGKKQQAIDAYLDYADRYPRRRISPEAVWKAAWISEELQDLSQAQELYGIVRKRWPGSSYAREAYFREGFTFYRLGKISLAENIFNEIRYKRWPDIHRNRAQYWDALCSELQNDSLTARYLRKELAVNLWDDYYTMKSYLLHKDEFDSSTGIIEQFKNSNKRLLYYATGFSSLLKYFEEAFEVQEVLGDKYAFGALEDIKLVAKSHEEWVALAEIYKKLQAYGKAYRTYDYIDKKFYSDQNYTEKSFILKERFPYYYDSYITRYSKSNNIEPELVLALMKQESVFDFKAHSWANAYGLMQLIPATAREMATLNKTPFISPNQLFDPEYNIKLGTRYLRQLSYSFNGRKEHMLAAYNAGPHRVKRWKKLPGSDQIDVFIENVEFEQTRDYVRKVMKNYWAYKLLQNNFQIESNDLLLGMLD
ncbi:MAG: tetratricopeptide repeat protein [Calditrichae bacterium]|nr:tetratricopeptide repeat protein [Calditrichia bacterium]